MIELIIAVVVCACEAVCVVIAYRHGKNAGKCIGSLEYVSYVINNILSIEQVNQFCSEQDMGLYEKIAVHKYALHVLECMSKHEL